MKNQREIYEALLAGETLIGLLSGARYKLADDNLVCISDGRKERSSDNSFVAKENYEIYTKPEWFENIPDGGVLCWVKNNQQCGYRSLPEIIDMCSDGCYRSVSGQYWNYSAPLTKQEIQVFMDNAPEE